MKLMDKDSQIENLNINEDANLSSMQGAMPNSMRDSILDRRNFFRKAGMFGFGAAVSALALKGTPAKAQANNYQSADTFGEMVTAFLIAEDLATTFYYAGLTGGVITDPNLAGPGGTATKVSASGNVGNVNYLQAALFQEIEHANVFRGLLTGSTTGASSDPVTTFYFPAGTFATLNGFLPILNALENAFIGAYINLVQELTYKATQAQAGTLTGTDAKYSAKEYQYFALVAGAILGVESEHRVLGRVIGNNNPANNYNFERTDGLTSIYNGPNSAVVALTPFLSSNGAFTEPHMLAPALANYRIVTQGVTVGGPLPPQ
jgi:hypothetical protein